MYDTYTVDPADEMLALGGRRAAVRHDPYEGIDPTLPENEGWIGHADCAREWDPCPCHGDRLCQLGKAYRWYRGEVSHLDYLRRSVSEFEDLFVAERDPKQADVYRQRLQAARMDAYLTERRMPEWPRDIWQLIIANARQAREEGRLL